MPPSTSHHKLPPFPDGIPTAPLLTIHLEKLEAGDADESSRFFQACKDLGFFYLDMWGSSLGERVVGLAEDVNALQERWWELPNDVKDQYGRPHLHEFFAYRYGEVTGQYDANGELVRNQNYNVSRDPPPATCLVMRCHLSLGGTRGCAAGSEQWARLRSR